MLLPVLSGEVPRGELAEFSKSWSVAMAFRIVELRANFLWLERGLIRREEAVQACYMFCLKPREDGLALESKREVDMAPIFSGALWLIFETEMLSILLI